MDRWDVERALKRSSLPAPSRLIIYTLLTHTTNGTLVIPSEYAPSLTALVEETGLSRGALSGHLNLLEDEGWLKRYRPTTKKALSERARTSYRITVPEGLLTHSGGEQVQEVNGFGRRTSSGDEPVQEVNGSEESQVGTRSGDEPVQEMNGTRSGAEHNPTSAQRSSPSEKKGGAGGKRRPAADGEHPAFAEWYAAYPVHKARGAAVKAFAKAVAKVDDPQILIAAAKRYREDPQVARGYGKHPATWLNAECWLDEPAPRPATPPYTGGSDVPPRDAYDPEEFV